MRILLVDDDPSLVQALLAALQSLPGQEVFSASSGPEAIDLAVQLGIDLLVTDVVMDPLDGFSLNEQLREQFPALRTIFVTGYDLSDYADRIGSSQVLQKPVAVESLLGAVQQEAAAARQTGGVAPKAIAVPKPTAVARALAAPAGGIRPAAVAKPTAAVRPSGTVRPPAAAPRPAAPVPATPKVAAVQPHVVPKPTPVAVPQPVGTTRAVPVARPGAQAPTPVQPKAPAPVARQAGARIEMPQATAARAAGPSALPPPPSAGRQSPPPNEPAPDLLGQLVGGYQIVSQLGEGRWGTVYAAVQTSINRPVGLKVLDPRRAKDDAQKQRFIADARAKAHVQHPSILSVYEAGAADGWIFYTHEYVDGQNLMEMYASDRTVDELTALKILRVAGEGLLYLSRNDIPHAALSSGDIYLGVDGHPRLSNIATQSADLQLTVGEEIQVLGESVWPVLAHPVSEGLQQLLGRTQQAAPEPINTWGPLLQGIKALEPKFVPIEAEKIGAQERAAAKAAEKVRQAQKRSFYLNLASMASLGLLAIFAIWHFLIASNERLLDQQVHIPAGQFLAGTGQTANAPEFWIDKYEVTIGEYAKFVDWIRAHPGDDHAYDHPRQPKQLSHVPEDWEIYFQRAKGGKPVHSAPISLNAPMMNVNWWDAYAYAKFKGRELPTELEWERAGRGTDGRSYPWGDEPDVKKANTNADYQPRDPAAKGGVDGFNFWGDVDAQKSDKSPDGVIGMAGNVSEWTLTWTPDNMKPILKGGNFSTPLTKLGDRFPTEPGKRDETIGFRTLTHKAPDK